MRTEKLFVVVFVVALLSPCGASAAIRVTDDPGSSRDPYVCGLRSGEGELSIVWIDDRSGPAAVYFTRVDGRGEKLLEDVRISQGSATASTPSCGVDIDGNTYIAWKQSQALYFAKVNLLGELVRAPFIRVASTIDQPHFDVEEDGTGHIVWVESTFVGGREVTYWQIDSNGDPIGGCPWLTLDPDIAGSNATHFPFVEAPSEASPLAAVSWHSRPFLDSDRLRLSYVAGCATIQATPDRIGGVVRKSALFSHPGAPEPYTFFEIQDGGWQVDWLDTPGSSTAINEGSGPATNPGIASADGEAFLVWEDARSGTPQIYSQSIDGSTGTLIGGNCLVSDGVSNARRPSAVRSGTDEYAIVWDDTRDGQNEEVYLAIREISCLGPPGPLPVTWHGSPIQVACDGPTNWEQPGFDDSSWDEIALPDLGGIDDPPPSDRFYRGRFGLPALTDDVYLFFRCDDGCEVFLNGHDLGDFGAGPCHTPGCVNLPSCPLGPNSCVPPIAVDPGLLVVGVNTLAVHVSNAAEVSHFDMSVSRGDPGTCGDCTIQPDEECDPTIPGGACDWWDECSFPGSMFSCACPLCGDSDVDPGEECDDGNTEACDGCSTICETEIGYRCPDGILNLECGEECDDGDNNSNTEPDACRLTCVEASCGDGVVDTGEECDDNNLADGDGCSANCESEIVQFDWTGPLSAVISKNYVLTLRVTNTSGVDQDIEFALNEEVVGDPFEYTTWEPGLQTTIMVTLPDGTEEAYCGLETDPCDGDAPRIVDTVPHGETYYIFTINNKWNWIEPWRAGRIFEAIVAAVGSGILPENFQFLIHLLRGFDEIIMFYQHVPEIHFLHTGPNLSETTAVSVDADKLVPFFGSVATAAFAGAWTSQGMIFTRTLFFEPTFFVMEAVLIVAAERMYAVAADPQPDYEELAVPQFIEIPEACTPAEAEAQFQDALHLSSRMLGFLAAMRDSFIRLDAAEDAGATDAMAMHIAAIRTYVEEARQVSLQLQGIVEPIVAMQVPPTSEQIEQAMQDLAETGLPEVEECILRAYGYDDDEIEGIEQATEAYFDDFFLGGSGLDVALGAWADLLSGVGEVVPSPEGFVVADVSCPEFGCGVQCDAAGNGQNYGTGNIACYVELSDHLVDDIQNASLVLGAGAPVAGTLLGVGDFDEDGQSDLAVEFECASLPAEIQCGIQPAAVSGTLLDGSIYTGVDLVTVDNTQPPAPNIIVPDGFQAFIAFEGAQDLGFLSPIQYPNYGEGFVSAILEGGTLTVRRLRFDGSLEGMGQLDGFPAYYSRTRPEFDTSGVFGHQLFLTLTGGPGGGQCGTSHVVIMAPNGEISVVQDYPLCDQVIAYAFTDGAAGYVPGAYLYDGNCDPSCRSSRLHQLDADFIDTILLGNAIPPGMPDLDPTMLAIDPNGNYGGLLTFLNVDRNNGFITSAHQLTPALTWTTLIGRTSLSNLRLADGTFSTGAAFGEFLYVREDVSNTVQIVHPDGTRETFASGFEGTGLLGNSIWISPDGRTLYVRDAQRIYAIRQPSVGADLVVQDVLIDDNDECQSATASLNASVVVANQGELAALGPFLVTLFEDQNSNGDFDPAVDQVFDVITVPTLEPGETMEVFGVVEGSVLFRDNLVYAFVDSEGVVPELDETNNIRSSGEDCLVAAPDLTASLVILDDGGYPDTVGVTVRVGNGGANVVAAPLNVAFYDGDPSAGGTLLGVAQTSIDLNPGEFEDVTLVVDPPPASLHTVCAVADNDGTGAGSTTECDETNNTCCVMIQNAAPEVDAGGPYFADEGSSVSVSATGTDADGDTLTYAWDFDTDGVFETPGQTVVFSAAGRDGPDTQEIFVQVTDDDGASAADSATVNIENVAPTADAGGPYFVDEGSSISVSATGTDAGGDTLTYVWDLDTDGVFETPGQTATFSAAGRDGPDTQEIFVQATDDDGASAADSATVNIENAAPTVNAGPDQTIDDGGPFISSGSFSDPGADTWIATVDYGDGTGVQPLALNPDRTFALGHGYVEKGIYTVTVCVTDDDGGVGCDTAIVTHYLTTAIDAPDITVQYSDAVLLRATLTDVYARPIEGAELSFVVTGLCTGSATTDVTGTAVLTCGPLTVGASDHTIDVAVIGGLAPLLRGSSAQGSLQVLQEDATIAYSNDNPMAIKVAMAGGESPYFELTVDVQETLPDDAGIGALGESLAAAGDIGLAEVTMDLVPIGPGATVSAVCEIQGVSGTGYDAVLTATCDFTGVEVNTYSVYTRVEGNFYTGEIEEPLTIYDPSLGFTTGGGWFYWPGSEDVAAGYPGDKTNYGFTIKYNRNQTNVRGNLLLIRHLPGDTKYRIKSNMIEGLALGESGGPGEGFGWSSFSGKCTYLEPGMDDPEGNHWFVSYVEDRNEPGRGTDRFWLQVKDKDRVLIPAMSMVDPAENHAVEITGGNIASPHNCIPNCDGRECGSDSCGGTCGTCPDDEICDPTAQVCCVSDLDSDGVCDEHDGAPEDPGCFAAPGETAGLSMGPETVTLSWTPPEASGGPGTIYYDVLRGSVADLHAGTGNGGTCIENDLAATLTEDDSVPPAGTVYYYLVRSGNACGTGGYGQSSSGGERLGNCP